MSNYINFATGALILTLVMSYVSYLAIEFIDESVGVTLLFVLFIFSTIGMCGWVLA
jgi:hypothetical protein